MTFWLDGMGNVLKAAGCKVVEVDGWKTRSYPRWSPGYPSASTVNHIFAHHTASKTSAENDTAYMVRGNGTFPGPIGNLYLARDGSFWCVAAGQALTEGMGSSRPWNGGVPDNEMNHHSISIEAGNNGIGEPWPKAQLDAYVRGVAALMKGFNIPLNNVRGHCEWAPGRKIDPAGPTLSYPTWGGTTGKATWNMNQFRLSVQKFINGPIPPAGAIIVENNMQILNPPVRKYDSRSAGGAMKAGETRVINLGTTAKAAFINVAAAQPTGAGYLTVWGSGTKPNSASLNFTTQESICNALPVPVAGGKITVFASTQTHIIVDLLGTYA